MQVFLEHIDDVTNRLIRLKRRHRMTHHFTEIKNILFVYYYIAQVIYYNIMLVDLCSLFLYKVSGNY